MKEMESVQRLGWLSLGVNIGLMLVKIATGVLGNCYALIADGVESAGDVVTTSVTWLGFKLSLRPADAEHPYGHGKIEALSGAFSGLSLLAAATLIAWQSIRQILTVHESPAWYTLPVLLAVVVVKELVSRKILAAGKSVESLAIKGDAWHHRSDAITSGAAAVGIALALFGGGRFSEADDWAALLACLIIYFNGFVILKNAGHEILDGKVGEEVQRSVVEVAGAVEGITDVEKCRIRKSGTDYFVELHVRVPAFMSVVEGHAVGHRVKDTVMERLRSVRDVVVHLEPASVRSELDSKNYRI
jgi:cation diffusion facilitator family transporter